MPRKNSRVRDDEAVNVPQELTPEEAAMLFDVLTRLKHTIAYLDKNRKEKDKGKRPRSKPDEYRVFNSLYAKVQTWAEGGK